MTIPPFNNTADWPRKVAQAINRLLNGAQGFERLPIAPAEPFEGRAYYDTTLHMARVWDGSAWNALW